MIVQPKRDRRRPDRATPQSDNETPSVRAAKLPFCRRSEATGTCFSRLLAEQNASTDAVENLQKLCSGEAAGLSAASDAVRQALALALEPRFARAFPGQWSFLKVTSPEWVCPRAFGVFDARPLRQLVIKTARGVTPHSLASLSVTASPFDFQMSAMILLLGDHDPTQAAALAGRALFKMRGDRKEQVTLSGATIEDRRRVIARLLRPPLVPKNCSRQNTAGVLHARLLLAVQDVKSVLIAKGRARLELRSALDELRANFYPSGRTHPAQLSAVIRARLVANLLEFTGIEGAQLRLIL